MEFIRITPSDPVDARQINNLQDALEKVDTSSGVSTTPVNGGTYTVKASDRNIIVDARGGAVKIIVPIPKVKQDLVIKNGYTTRNAVTIVRVDNQPFSTGVGSIVAGMNASDRATFLLADGSQWWVL